MQQNKFRKETIYEKNTIALVYLHRTSFGFTQRSGIEVSTADTVFIAVKSSVRKVSNSRTFEVLNFIK